MGVLYILNTIADERGYAHIYHTKAHDDILNNRFRVTNDISSLALKFQLLPF